MITTTTTTNTTPTTTHSIHKAQSPPQPLEQCPDFPGACSRHWREGGADWPRRQRLRCLTSWGPLQAAQTAHVAVRETTCAAAPRKIKSSKPMRKRPCRPDLSTEPMAVCVFWHRLPVGVFGQIFRQHVACRAHPASGRNKEGMQTRFRRTMRKRERERAPSGWLMWVCQCSA